MKKKMLIRFAMMTFDDDDDDDDDEDSYENSVWYNVEEAEDLNDSNTYITMMLRNETIKKR